MITALGLLCDCIAEARMADSIPGRGMLVERIDRSRRLIDYDIDSLDALHLCNRIEYKLGITLPDELFYTLINGTIDEAIRGMNDNIDVSTRLTEYSNLDD